MGISEQAKTSSDQTKSIWQYQLPAESTFCLAAFLRLSAEEAGVLAPCRLTTFCFSSSIWMISDLRASHVPHTDLVPILGASATFRSTKVFSKFLTPLQSKLQLGSYIHVINMPLMCHWIRVAMHIRQDKACLLCLGCSYSETSTELTGIPFQCMLLQTLQLLSVRMPQKTVDMTASKTAF